MRNRGHTVHKQIIVILSPFCHICRTREGRKHLHGRIAVLLCLCRIIHIVLQFKKGRCSSRCSRGITRLFFKALRIVCPLLIHELTDIEIPVRDGILRKVLVVDEEIGSLHSRLKILRLLCKSVAHGEPVDSPCLAS